jgi:hypothetical protein
LHRLWLFIIGLVILIAAFISAFPASIYTAQQFNTNYIAATFGIVFLAFSFFPGKNGK